MQLPRIIFSADFDQALGWTVLHSIWQITVIAVLAGIILLVQRNRTARSRYWVANAALLAILLSTAATFMWYKKSYSPELQGVKKELQTLQTTDSVAVGNVAMLVSSGAKMRISQGAEAAKPTFQDYFEQHLPLVVLIWLLGMAFCLFRLMGSLSYVYYLKQRMNFPADPYWTDVLDNLAKRAGFQQTIGLVESALVRSTITIGYLKPLILFPIGVINRLSEQEVEAILAHELAHILRRDYLFNILQCVVEALFYYHPAVWWLSTQVRNERESACDDMAIALLGNKLNYAKALVTMQEMAFYTLSPALGMAGQNQSQFMSRVQRLFSQPKIKFDMFEKWIATGLVVCSIVALAFGQHIQNQKTEITANGTRFDNARSGIWEADFQQDSVCLFLVSRTRNSNWSTGRCYPKTAFANLTVAEGQTEFKMTRPAGVLTFRGAITAQSGYGRFEFTPDETFKSNLTRQGIKNVDDEVTLHCFLANFQPDYLDFMAQKGFKNIDKDQLTELAVFGLDQQAVNQYIEMSTKLGQKQVTVDNLVQLRVANVTSERIAEYVKLGLNNLNMEDISALSIHDVDPEFITAMNAQGFGKLSSEDILAAKIHGITPEFVGAAKSQGLGNLSFDDMVAMKIHGITPEFISQAKSQGVGNLSFDDIVSMKIQGVTPEFISQAKSQGLGDLSYDDLVTMKIQGITPEFVNQAKSQGLGNLSFDDIVTMKIHGITPEFISQAKSQGFDNLSFDDIVSMKIHGIDPAFIKQCKESGLGNLSFDDVMSMKIHGIDPAFVKQCKDLGLGDLSFDDIMSLKIQGVTPALAQSFRDLGIKEMEAEDLIAAKIHGITPEYIKECAEKGFKSTDLQDYINRKVRNQVNSGRRSSQ